MSLKALFLLNPCFFHQPEAVIPDGFDERDGGFAVFGQGIFGAGRHNCKHHAMDVTVALQFTELDGEHFVGNMGNIFFQFAVAVGAGLQPPQDGHFPGATELIHGQFDGVVVNFSVVNKIGHIQGWFSVSQPAWPALESRVACPTQSS